MSENINYSVGIALDRAEAALVAGDQSGAFTELLNLREAIEEEKTVEHKALPPIELLYNQRYERVGHTGQSWNTNYTVARVLVQPQYDKIVIELPESGSIQLSYEGWATLIQEVEQRFEEAHSD